MGFFLLIVYLVLTFVRPGELVPAVVAWRITEVVSVLALIAAGVGLFTGRGPALRSPQIILFLALFGWAAVSLVATGNGSGPALERLVDFVKSSAVAFILLVLNVDSIRRIKTVAAMFAMLTLFEAGQGVLAYHSGRGADQFLLGTSLEQDPSAMRALEEGEGVRGGSAQEGLPRIRALGHLADPNDLANVLVAILPLLLPFRRTAAPWRNLVLVWIPIAATLYSVYLTRSRGGLLGLAAVVALLFRGRLGRIGAGAVAALILITLVWLGYTGGRAMAIDQAAADRIDAWSDGLLMLKGSPVWGVGFGMFAQRYGVAAHSSLVESFAELGLVGYFLWLGLLVVTLDDLRCVGRRDEAEPEADPGDSRELSDWARALTVSMVGFLVGGLFLSRAHNVMLYLFLGLGVGVRNVARRLGRSWPQRHLLVWVLGILLLEGASIVALWGYMRVLR